MSNDSLFQVLKAPHVSEKSALIAERANVVTFKVALSATKPEIRKAVEKLFQVKVVNVQTLTVKGKVKRNRYGQVKKSSWKKAYVTLADGHDIDFAIAG